MMIIAIIIIVLVLIFSLFRDFFAEKLLELLDRKCRFEVFGCEFISKVNFQNFKTFVKDAPEIIPTVDPFDNI